MTVSDSPRPNDWWKDEKILAHSIRLIRNYGERKGFLRTIRIADESEAALARLVACEKAIRERRSLEIKEDDWHTAYERSETQVESLKAALTEIADPKPGGSSAPEIARCALGWPSHLAGNEGTTPTKLFPSAWKIPDVSVVSAAGQEDTE